MSSELTVTDPASNRRLALQVLDPMHVLDTAKFEHMQRIAITMAESSLVPETLVGYHEGYGQNRKLILYPIKTAVANCFQVVAQSVRWNMDPFAVAQCCSVVHGKLMFEGKLVAAVIDAKLGVKLSFEWDDKPGDNFGIVITGPADQRGKPRIVDGTVGDWKTTGANSPWTKRVQQRLQLAYRGVREWCRLYEPALLLGVYTPDEMEGLVENDRGSRAWNDKAPPPAPVLPKPAEKQITTNSEIAEARDVVPASEAKGAEGESVSRTTSAPNKSEPETVEVTEVTEVTDTAAAAREEEDRNAADEPEITPEARTEEIVGQYATAETAEDCDEIEKLFEDDMDTLGRELRQKVEAAAQAARERVATKVEETPAPEPLVIPETFASTEVYVAWLRASIAASTPETEPDLKLCWNETKKHRSALGLKRPDTVEIHAELGARLKEIAPPPAKEPTEAAAKKAEPPVEEKAADTAPEKPAADGVPTTWIEFNDQALAVLAEKGGVAAWEWWNKHSHLIEGFNPQPTFHEKRELKFDKIIAARKAEQGEA